MSEIELFTLTTHAHTEDGVCQTTKPHRHSIGAVGNWLIGNRKYYVKTEDEHYHIVTLPTWTKAMCLFITFIMFRL